MRKLAPKKLKTTFQDELYSSSLTSRFISTQQLEELLNLVFLLILRTQSLFYSLIRPKYQLTNVFIFYRSPAASMSTWSQSWLHISLLPPPKKIFCITPWVRSWWESAHIQFSLWSVYHMFLYDETWCQLHLEGSCIQCQQLCELSTWYLSGHIQYLRHIVSIGNRFPWFYINCLQSPWFQCIIIESCDGCQEGGAGCMFLNKGGYQEGGGVKEERGADTPFCTMLQYYFNVPNLVIITCNVLS